jgi:hypothetical protein
MGILHDQMIEEMKLRLFSLNAAVLRLRGKQTGQISPQVARSAKDLRMRQRTQHPYQQGEKQCADNLFH